LQPSFQRFLRLSVLAATIQRAVSVSLQAHITVLTKRFFLILGALVVVGDAGSVVFAVSESSAVTATAILIALVSAFALTAASEFKPDPDKAQRNRTVLVTSAKLPLQVVVKAMLSSGTINPQQR
jgi:hypothetical protein